MSLDSNALRELLEQGSRWGTFVDQYPRGNRSVSSNIINLGELDQSILVKDTRFRGASGPPEHGSYNLLLTRPLYVWIEPTDRLVPHEMIMSALYTPYSRTVVNINGIECFPANSSSSGKPIITISCESLSNIQSMEIIAGNSQDYEITLNISVPSTHVGSLNRLVIIEFVCKEALDRFSQRVTTFKVGLLLLGTIAGIANPSVGMKPTSINGSNLMNTSLSSEATPFIPISNLLQFDSTNAIVISDDYQLKLLLSPPPQFSHIVAILETVHSVDPDLYKQYVEFYHSNRLPELALQHNLNHLSEIIFRESSWQIPPTEYLSILCKLTLFEEIQTKLDIAKFDLHVVKINFELIRENNVLSISLKCKLHVQGSNESRPRILIGDKIRIRPTIDDCHSRRMDLFELHGLVTNYQLQSEEVTCVFDVRNVFAIDGVQSSPLKLIELLSCMRFEVRFSYDRSSFAMMNLLLKSRMVTSQWLIDSLFPSPGIINRLKEAKQMQVGLANVGGRIGSASNFVRLSVEFNQEQSRAITSIVDWCDLNKPNIHNLVYSIPPFIIFGPPGTGKTRTVTASIIEIIRTYPHKRILACAPSEAAADVIALRLFDALTDRKLIFRLNWWQRMVSSVPPKLLPCCCQHGNLFELPSEEQLKSYSVIVTTCSAAGAVAFYENLRFDVVIIDEASQATEAESLIPLSLTKPGGLMVLAGDINQLGPATKFPIYQDCAPAASLQERLLGLPFYSDCLPSNDAFSVPSSVSLGVFLSRNYRSHRLLLDVPSKLFYGHRLISCANSNITNSLLGWEMLSNRKAPLLFAGVEGKQEHDIDSPSFYNDKEVAKVVEICQSLASSQLVEPRNIGVIAAFRRQVLKIRVALRAVSLGAVNVGSVEDFQGQEVTAVIISTVTTSLIKRFANKGSYGMVNDAKRFNVSITRGMALCVVVGHPEFLYLDPYWRRLLDYVYQHGNHTGAVPEAVLKWEDHYEEDLLNSTIETVMSEMYPQISNTFARLFHE